MARLLPRSYLSKYCTRVGRGRRCKAGIPLHAPPTLLGSASARQPAFAYCACASLPRHLLRGGAAALHFKEFLPPLLFLPLLLLLCGAALFPFSFISLFIISLLNAFLSSMFTPYFCPKRSCHLRCIFCQLSSFKGPFSKQMKIFP